MIPALSIGHARFKATFLEAYFNFTKSNTKIAQIPTVIGN
jgi:hypothetical protein